MKTIRTIVAAAAMLLLLPAAEGLSQTAYKPSESNLEARKEFVRERFGIFLHWGIYASYAQGEWYLQNAGLNKDEYAKAAGGFYPAAYDASEWVRAFKDAGAEYVTITSRHHDGFSMFDTQASDYNIVDSTPWGKDVIRDLADACEDQGLKLQFYYSILDWIREDYPIGSTGRNSGRAGDHPDYDSYFSFMKQQVGELIAKYSPRALWFDGYWDHPTGFDWRMEEFYNYIHGLDPACLIGNNHHVATLEGEDFQMFERDLPGQNTMGFSPDQEISDVLPLEMCETMNSTWGYSVSDRSYKSSTQLIRTLATLVSMNSNLLLNIGPQADGRLPQDALDRLRDIGEWMKVNSESIKACGPGPLAKQDWGVTTAPADCDKVFYLHVLDNPGAVLEIPLAKKAKVRSAIALDGGTQLPFKKVGEKLIITLPGETASPDYVVKVVLK